MGVGVYGASAVGSGRWPAAYLVVVSVLAGLGALLNLLVFYVSIFATDDCLKGNPAFRCTGAGMVTMCGAPWVGLAGSVGASVAFGAWWGLPVGAAVYAAGLAATWQVMRS